MATLDDGCERPGANLENPSTTVDAKSSRLAPAAAQREGDGYNAVLEEIERWERLSADEIDKFRDEDGLLNQRFKQARVAAA